MSNLEADPQNLAKAVKTQSRIRLRVGVHPTPACEDLAVRQLLINLPMSEDTYPTPTMNVCTSQQSQNPYRTDAIPRAPLRLLQPVEQHQRCDAPERRL